MVSKASIQGKYGGNKEPITIYNKPDHLRDSLPYHSSVQRQSNYINPCCHRMLASCTTKPSDATVQKATKWRGCTERPEMKWTREYKWTNIERLWWCLHLWWLDKKKTEICIFTFEFHEWVVFRDTRRLWCKHWSLVFEDAILALG